MKLFTILWLARELGVTLSLNERGGIRAVPHNYISEELDQAIRENKETLIEHLELLRDEEIYEVLTEVGIAGIALRRKDGRLYGLPGEAVLASGLRDKIARYKDCIITMQKVHDATVRSTSEVTMLARARFDTEPYEHPMTKNEMWTDSDKAEFFKASK